MFKIYLFFFGAIFLRSLLVPQVIYDVQFRDIGEQPIAMSAFSGKKILVRTFDARAPDIHQIRLLDSITLIYQSALSVIAIPVSDFSSPLSDSILKNKLIDSAGVHFIVSASGKGQKANGDLQQPLVKWLTHRDLSHHFDTDITQGWQLFLASETGIHYVEFSLPVTNDILNAALIQTVNDPN